MLAEHYLISSSRRAHRLRSERAYVFGRDTAADIRIDDALASRRHAEARWADEAWTLVDLGSRNGVLVNGQRVEQSRRLNDGDQIQIGGQVFRYHLLPPGGDPVSLSAQAPQIANVETMGPGLNLADIAAQGAAFTGVVSDGLLELLQFMVTTRKTGRLDLVGGVHGVGMVWIEAGTPVHASTAQRQGIEALVALTSQPPPRFAFHTGEAAPAITITGTANGVLMEVARLVDEQTRPA